MKTFGGHVDKLTGDGIMAVFGAPVAHEDDPERAVRAALAMQRAVRRVLDDERGGGAPLGLRVGLNTGEVVAGVQAALEYTVIGDTVNTAARLADAAAVGAQRLVGVTSAMVLGASEENPVPLDDDAPVAAVPDLGLVGDLLEVERVLARVPVRRGAVATSGTAHRGAHLVDARTGLPPVGVASVTVVRPDLTWADIDATAAYAHGTDALRWLHSRPGCGLVVWADGRTEVWGQEPDSAR